MKTPIWIAKEAYESCDPPYAWTDMLNAHMSQGYCVSSTEYFICARPVIKGAPVCELLDPNFEFPLQQCNAWFVYLAAGNALPSLWTVQPLQLPWVIYYRLKGDKLRVFNHERLRRISHGQRQTKTTTEASTNRNT